MIIWTPTVLSVLYACVLYFCICTCSAQLSMFHMERRCRNTLIIIIIIIFILLLLLLFRAPSNGNHNHVYRASDVMVRVVNRRKTKIACMPCTKLDKATVTVYAVPRPKRAFKKHQHTVYMTHHCNSLCSSKTKAGL